MSTTYKKYRTANDEPMQVDSAIRDGAGKNIENNYSKQEGYYGGMGVKEADYAKDLISTTGITVNDDPMSFGIVGGAQKSAVGDGNASLNKLVCVDVVKNQYLRDPDFADMSAWWVADTATAQPSVENGVLSWDSTAGYIQNNAEDMLLGHMYLYCIEAKRVNTDTATAVFYGNGYKLMPCSGSGNWEFLSTIVTCDSSSGNRMVRLYATSSGSTAYYKKPRLIDLTQRYGNNDVVNAIIGTGTDDEKLARLLAFDPEILNDIGYDEGTLVPSKTAKLNVVDYNQFSLSDFLERIGATNPASVNVQTQLDGAVLWKNEINYVGRVYINFSGATSGGVNGAMVRVVYTDGTSQALAYLNVGGEFVTTAGKVVSYIGTSYNNYTTYNLTNAKICISFYSDGSQVGYRPYQERFVALPNYEGHGILKVVTDSQTGITKVVADGTELYPDGNSKKRYDTYTFTGNETWNWSEVAQRWIWSASVNDAFPLAANMLTLNVKNYETDAPVTVPKSLDTFYSEGWNFYGAGSTNYLQIKDSVNLPSTVNPRTVFTAGKKVVYQLATEEDITTPVFQSTFPVEQGGTLQFLDENDNPIAGLQGSEILYAKSTNGAIQGLFNRQDIKWNPNNVASKAQLGQTNETIRKIIEGEQDVGKSKLSDNFDSKLVYNDNLAYIYRTTAGGEDVANQIKQKAIVGGSLGWNQLQGDGNFETAWAIQNGSGSVSNNVMTFTATAQNGQAVKNVALTAGHKYLSTIDMLTDAPANTIQYIGGSSNYIARNIASSSWQTLAKVWDSAQASYAVYGYNILRDTRDSDWTAIQVRNAMIIDLTACFGATIADYIYNLEQATAGAGVAWFRRYFPKPYYPFKAIGGFTHVQTKGKKYVGFNQFAGTSFPAYRYSWYTDRSLSQALNPTRLLANNTYKVTGDQAGGDNSTGIRVFDLDGNILGTEAVTVTGIGMYYDAGGKFFKSGIRHTRINVAITSSVDCYIDVVAPSECNNPCINLHWDGERDGEYEAYKERNYPVDPIELIGIPHIDAQGNLYFEGDIYESDGNVTRKFGIVDLGTLTWYFVDGNAHTFFVSTPNLPTPTPKLGGEGICSRYQFVKDEILNDSSIDKAITILGRGTVGIRLHDNAYSTVESLTASLSGVYLVYELAEPTTSEATSYSEIQEGDNWGTEQWLAPDDDTRPVEVPVGNDTDYLPDLKAKLESAPSLPDSDGDYVMHYESGTAEYIPLATWLLENGYPQANVLASKEALGGTLRQMLAATKSIDFLNTDYVDLGDVDYTAANVSAGTYYGPVSGMYAAQLQFICSKYKSVTYEERGTDMSICTSSGLVTGKVVVYIHDSSLANKSAAEAKASLKGVLLAFEKASS